MIGSLLIELCSTMYIATVSDKSISMIFWAFIGPFLNLPFFGYMVESNNWNDRIKMTLSLSIGYAIGAIIIYKIFI